MWEELLTITLKKLDIKYDYNYLINMNILENRMYCPYLPNFSISINEYYEDKFLEILQLNLYLEVKKIDYQKKIFTFENNDTYKLFVYTENPSIYTIKLVDLTNNINVVFYQKSIIVSHSLIINEFFKLINYLKILSH